MGLSPEEKLNQILFDFNNGITDWDKTCDNIRDLFQAERKTQEGLLKRIKELEDELKPLVEERITVEKMDTSIKDTIEELEAKNAETEEVGKLLVDDPALDRDNKKEDSLRVLVITALNGLYWRSKNIEEITAKLSAHERVVEAVESYISTHLRKDFDKLIEALETVYALPKSGKEEE